MKRISYHACQLERSGREFYANCGIIVIEQDTETDEFKHLRRLRRHHLWSRYYRTYPPMVGEAVVLAVETGVGRLHDRAVGRVPSPRARGDK